MAKYTDFCSFCGRNKKDVNILISGMGSFICDECANEVLKIVETEKKTVFVKICYR